VHRGADRATDGEQGRRRDARRRRRTRAPRNGGGAKRCRHRGSGGLPHRLRPDREMFSSGANPIVLLRNVAALGRVSVCELHAEELPALAEIDPGQSYLAWTMEIATHRMRPVPWCLGCPRKPSASEEPHGCSHSAISVLRCWRGLDEPPTSDVLDRARESRMPLELSLRKSG